MQANIVFDNVRVYDFTQADVVLGQEFSIETDQEELQWFANNDEVLSIEADGSGASVKAEALGTSLILLLHPSFFPFAVLKISVVEAIEGVEPATGLNVRADTPVPKS
jgi:hypothetical protein